MVNHNVDIADLVLLKLKAKHYLSRKIMKSDDREAYLKAIDKIKMPLFKYAGMSDKDVKEHFKALLKACVHATLSGENTRLDNYINSLNL